jgi:hypothetical protein
MLQGPCDWDTTGIPVYLEGTLVMSTQTQDVWFTGSQPSVLTGVNEFTTLLDQINSLPLSS